MSGTVILAGACTPFCDILENKHEIVLDRAYPQWYNMYIMTSVPNFDSSYSPNEACEASDIPNCGACYDEGMIVDEDVYCDCPEGDKAMNKDSKNELYEDTYGVNPECLEPIYDASEEGDYYDDFSMFM